MKFNHIWTYVSENKENNRFISGSFFSVLSSLFSRGITLLTSIFIARHLGSEEYGEFATIQSTVVLTASIAGLGLSVAATKYLAVYYLSDPVKSGKILTLTSLISLISAAISSIIILITSPLIANHVFNEVHLELNIKIGALLGFLTILTNFQIGVLSGFGKFKIIMLTNLFSGLASFPLILLSTWYWGVTGSLLGLSINMLVLWAMNSYNIKKICNELNIKKSTKNIWHEKEILWQFALPTALSALLTSPVIWIANILLINQTNGYSELGVFNAAQQWQSIILFAPLALTPMLLSMLSHANHINNNYYWKIVTQASIINMLIFFILATPIIIFSSEILSLYGHDFLRGKSILAWLSFAALFISLSNIVGQIIASSASMWVGFFLNSIWALTFLVLNFFFIDLYKAEGMAISYFLSYMLHFFLCIIYIALTISSGSMLKNAV